MKFVPPNNQPLTLHKDAEAIIKALMEPCHIHTRDLEDPNGDLDNSDWYFIEIARVTANALGKTKAANSLQELQDFMTKHHGATIIND